MGNLAFNNNDGVSPLALVAVTAHYMHALNKSHVLRLRYECSKLSFRSETSGERTYFISRDAFRKALLRTLKPGNNRDKSIVVEILDLLFIMMDEDCKDRVNYRNYCCGIAPFACKEGDNLQDVLEFCLRVVDDKSTEMVEARHLMAVLVSITSTASYMGDSVLRPQQIRSIVDDVIPKFGTKGKIISRYDCVGRLYQHPLVHDFIEGKRKNVQVSFKFEGDDEDDLQSEFGSSFLNPYSSAASDDDLLFNKFSSMSSTDSDYAVLSSPSSDNWLNSLVSAKGDIVTC